MLIGLGLVLVVEGLAYAIFADGMKRMLLQIADMSPATLRSAGLVAAIAGLVLLLGARWLFGSG